MAGPFSRTVPSHFDKETGPYTYQQVEGQHISHKLLSSISILWAPNLQELHVSLCKSLQVVFDLDGLMVEQNRQGFIHSQLRTLKLEDLHELRHVWKNIPRGFQGFRNLRFIDIKSCPCLLYLFSLSIAKLLVGLESVSIQTCNKIENILEVGEEEDAVEIIVFPKFRSMHEIYLYECPNLITFGPEIRRSTTKPKKINVGLDSKLQDHTGTTSSVKKAPGFLDRCLDCVLRRKKLQGSSSLGGNEPEFQGQILHPPVNKEVDPNGNDRDIHTEIRSLIPSSLINSMQNLQLLEAVKCNSLEAIFELEGLNLEKSSAFIACNNLRELKLRTLPKLKHIWKDGPQEITGFHELRLLVVSECHNLKYLFSPSIAKLLVELEEIEVKDCNEMEAILGAEARENEKSEVTFPNVHTLSLVRLRKLECFCVEANAFKWPSLTKVKVVGCDKLKMFVPRKVETPPELVRVNTDLRELKFQYMVGDLNDAIREMKIKCEGRSLQSQPADWKSDENSYSLTPESNSDGESPGDFEM